MHLGLASLTPIVTMLFNLMIGILVYRRNPSSKSAIAFLYLAITFALWQGSAALQRASEEGLAVFWNQAQYAFVSLIIISFTYFTNEFLIGSKTSFGSRYLRWALYITGFAFTLLSFSGLVITNEVQTDTYHVLGINETVYHGTYGPAYWAFAVAFIGAIALNLVAYLQSLSTERSTNRKKGITLILGGTMVVGILGTITDVILPIFHIIMPLADVLTAIDTGFMAIAMVKYKVFAIAGMVEGGSAEGEGPALEGPFILVPTTKKNEHFELFNEYTRSGKLGIIITTTPPEEIRPQLANPKVPIVWLSNKETKQYHLNPTQFDEIYEVLDYFQTEAKGGVVLFDLSSGLIEKIITTKDFVWTMVEYFKKLEHMLQEHGSTVLIARKGDKEKGPTSYQNIHDLLLNSRIILGVLQRYGFLEALIPSLEDDEKPKFKNTFGDMVNKKYDFKATPTGWELLGPQPTDRKELVSLLRSLLSALKFIKREDVGERLKGLCKRIGIKEAELLLHPGGAFILFEQEPTRAFQYLHQLSDRLPCICIMRSRPDQIQRAHEVHKDCRILWMTEQSVKKDAAPEVETIRPSLEHLMQSTEKFLDENPGGLILIEGLDYFITHTEFDAMLRLFEKMVDVVWMKKGVLLIPIDPQIIDEKQKSLLKRVLEEK
jgi:hypothetical protein